MIRLIEGLIYPLFFLTVALGLGYWYWTTTPSYALSQIVASVKNKDCDTFERYVDIDSIVYRAIDDILRGPARESGMFGNLDQNIGVGIIGFFKPEIADIARAQITSFINKGTDLPGLSAPENGTPEKASAQEIQQADDSNFASYEKPHQYSLNKYAKEFKVKRQLYEYGLSKDGFHGVDYLKTAGPITLVGIKFHSPKLNRDFIVELKMEDAGGYWRITELSNLNDLISLYLETRDKIGSFHHRVIPITGMLADKAS